VGDTVFNGGEQVTSNFEDWVSATQSTNGVAGDTIQKGELLTLRFFGENILGDVNPGAPGGGTEKLDPTTSANGLVIKFDGIGSSEDLMLTLNLIDYGADGVAGGIGANADTETTKSMFVQNADFYKGNTVPSPYNTEFTLDNNDGLVIIEDNDWNALGEHFQLQGVQIMQSANGLTGKAIDLTKGTGTLGGSDATSNLVDWDPTDQDVLKITDIGFVQSTSGTIDANLNFAFQLVDGDGDMTALQNIAVQMQHDLLI